MRRLTVVGAGLAGPRLGSNRELILIGKRRVRLPEAMAGLPVGKK
jgi:hypothetical protein